jgi:hypothetical protein
MTTGNMFKTTERLYRDICLKVYFAGESDSSDDDSDEDRAKSKLFVKSKWIPPPDKIPNWVDQRTSKFFVRLQQKFKHRQASTNLLPCQERLLDQLLNDPNLLFPETDKGLGPCVVLYDQYVQDVLRHLRDDQVYQNLSREQALLEIDILTDKIHDWLKTYKHCITDQNRKYIELHLEQNAESPFGQFYIMYKIHMGMRDDGTWPTRPVCSDVSSIPHGLGKWVTEKLQPVAQAQPSYFKDTFAIKDMLDPLNLPLNARLFTALATSMYTNIQTEPALHEISEYLRDHHGVQFFDYNPDAVISALEIGFRNNYFAVGDTYWKQKPGTGMGMSPAPPWATIFFALLENREVPNYATWLMFFKHFIDDIIGIWLMDPDPVRDQENWEAFKAVMNTWHGLEWIFSEGTMSVNFMDLTISIQSSKLHTTIYEKEQNLYLYLPPHSSHPKGVKTGLVLGKVLRIRRLCTDPQDADTKIREFLHQLLARGRSRDSLEPLFCRAEENTAAYLSRDPAERERLRLEKAKAAKNQVYFHVQFHPDDPPAREIQELWREYVAHPAGDIPLPACTNDDGDECGIDKLVIAYSRPLNLQNMFSVCNIHGRGREVSSFLA